MRKPCASRYLDLFVAEAGRDLQVSAEGGDVAVEDVDAGQLAS